MADFVPAVLLDTLRFTAVFLVVTVTVACIIFKWRYQYWKREDVPFIPPVIPYGNVGNIWVKPRDENIAEIYKTARSEGWRYCGLFLLLSPAILIVDIDLVKRVLTKDFQFFSERNTYTNEKVDPIGCHLFSLSAHKWKNLRSKLTPAFSSGKLKGMFQTLVDCGLRLEKYIDENVVANDPVNIETIMHYFSTNVVGSCVFGIECDSFKDPDALFNRFSKHFVVSKFDTTAWLFLDNFPRLSRLLGLRQVKKGVADFFMDLANSTVAYREANNYQRKDFMQLLIDIKNGERDTLTMNEIAAQTFLFFVAGSGSTSTILTFAFFELATHPHVQDRLKGEIQEVLAKYDGKITYDSINEMKYMGQVLDEILRMYSPARVIERKCVDDYNIPGSQVLLKKGTRVMISIKGIHNDSAYWDDPEIFDPERFSEKNLQTLNHFAHLPFGQGPKGCLAERFGRMQVKVGLVSVLRKYRVSLNGKTKIPLTMSLDSLSPAAEGGIWLNIEKL